MVTVTVFNRATNSSEIHDFSYAHSARTWLILSGFLPMEFDDDQFVRQVTGCTAYVERV